jgi:hypothetical protein
MSLQSFSARVVIKNILETSDGLEQNVF